MRYSASGTFITLLVALMATRVSVLAAQATSIRVLPVIGSAPETGFVGGATALRVSSSATDTSTRPSTDQFYAAYTAKQQFRAFVSTDRWSAGNRWGMNSQLEYQRFPQPFYGIGIDAPESAEEWYEARSVIANVMGRRKLARALYAQLGYRFSTTTHSRCGRRRHDR